jgi:hypothetical protein
LAGGSEKHQRRTKEKQTAGNFTLRVVPSVMSGADDPNTSLSKEELDELEEVCL